MGQPAWLSRLLAEALRVIGNSYAPYSGVHVAAVVEAEDGSLHAGVNVENASYGLTICAERAAVAAMVAAGRRRIRRVLVVSDAPRPLPPCGACLQVIAEFAEPQAEICSYSIPARRAECWSLGQLAPMLHGVREAVAEAAKRRPNPY